MTRFDAFHLPGFDPATSRVDWAELRPGSATLRYPVLTPAALREIANTLRRNRLRFLSNRPVHDVIRAVDRAAARLAADGELRELAIELLPQTTRFSRPMVELIVDRMAADWRAGALERLLASELGDGAVLDRFVVEPGARRRVRALGPELTLNVFAGNVPGVSVTALVRCLLVKSAVFGKTAADDPVLPVLFARALAREDAELASCVALTYWPGGQAEAEDAALAEADAIVVYGGADVVRSVRARAPGRARVIEHGPRVSFGFVARESLAAAGVRELARDIAQAAATFDQHGCVSLHGAFVERGGAVDPGELAHLVFEELTALESRLPTGILAPDEAARLHAERARAEFQHIEGGAVHAATAAGATVVYAPVPDGTPSCLDRFIRISAVDDLREGIAELAPLGALLQSAALAAPVGRADAIASDLAAAGFTRITPFRHMPWPPAHWHHDGASPLRELVRWVDFEDAAGD